MSLTRPGLKDALHGHGMRVQTSPHNGFRPAAATGQVAALRDGFTPHETVQDMLAAPGRVSIAELRRLTFRKATQEAQVHARTGGSEYR